MRVLVTGGGGFLGQALCRALVARGEQVTAFQRHAYPELDALGVRQVIRDLGYRPRVSPADGLLSPGGVSAA